MKNSLENNIKYIESFSNLGDKWNSYGSFSVTNDVCDMAISLLKEFDNKQPRIYPTKQNTIQFKWGDTPGRYLEMEIYGYGYVKVIYLTHKNNSLLRASFETESVLISNITRLKELITDHYH